MSDLPDIQDIIEVDDQQQPVPDTPAEPTPEPVIEAEASEEAPSNDNLLEESQKKFVKENLNQHVTLDRAICRPYHSDDDIKEGEEIIAVPTTTGGQAVQIVAQTPQMETSTEERDRWVDCFNAGGGVRSKSDIFVESTRAEGREWKQYIQAGNEKVAPVFTRAKLSGGELMDDRAHTAMLNSMGVGARGTVPLIHSGFTVTLKAPLEANLLELMRDLSDTKIKYGRLTYGLAYNSSTAYTRKKILDFALNHIHSCSVNNFLTNPELLRANLHANDVDTLIMAMMASIYPNGFQYMRSCTHRINECFHTETGRCDVNRMMVFDDGLLTPWQRTHLATGRAANTKDVDSILKYQKEFSYQPTVIKLKTASPVTITLKTKINADEALNSSIQWIESIVATVNQAVSKPDLSDEEKNKLIIDNLRTARACQYAHYVDRISYLDEDGQEESFVKAPQAIYQSLTVMSQDTEVTAHFLTQVLEHIEKTQLSLVGISDYDCPNCKKSQVEGLETATHFPTYIPMDVVQTFFQLLMTRIRIIRTREGVI